MFNVIYLVSGGEPDGGTDILISQAYRWAFTRGHRYGYAAAYAVLAYQTAWMKTHHPEEFFALGWQAAVEAMSKEFQNQFEKDGETQLIQLNEPQIDQEDKE